MAAVSDADLHARARSACVQLIFMALKHARSSRSMASQFADLYDLMVAVLREPRGADALRLVFRYYLEVRGADERGVLDAIASELPGDMEASMQTIAQWLEERGMKRGEEQGREQGRRQGQHDLLLRLLRHRFGPLPPAVLARLDAADEPTLARWAEQLFTAKTLDAVFTAG